VSENVSTRPLGQRRRLARLLVGEPVDEVVQAYVAGADEVDEGRGIDVGHV
jgi:hypothetical protein